MKEELFEGFIVTDNEYTDEFIDYIEQTETSLTEEGDWADLNIKEYE